MMFYHIMVSRMPTDGCCGYLQAACRGMPLLPEELLLRDHLLDHRHVLRRVCLQVKKGMRSVGSEEKTDRKDGYITL